jgi:hypothetical protein
MGWRAGLGVLAGVMATIWLVGAGFYGLAVRGQGIEMRARYRLVELSRSAEAQGSPEFIALPAPVQPMDGLVMRRSNASDGVHFLPLPAAGGEVHWIVRWEGLSQAPVEWPLLAHGRGEVSPTVVRDAFAAEGTRLAEDAVVVERVLSRDGVVLDRSDESSSWFLGVASLVSVIVALLAAMLGVLGRFATRTPIAKDSGASAD